MKQCFKEEIAAIWLEDLVPSQDGTIPEALEAHLFDGPQRTYAVFDTAAVNEGLTLIEAEPGYRGSLLEGEVVRDLADVAPCLLELSSDAKLTRKLFREVQGYAPALGSLHLWPVNPALFIRCNSDPGTLRRHLRRFVKPLDYEGRRRYVRLWNPAITYDYLHDFDSVTPFLRLYLNAPQDPLTLIARKGSCAVIARTLAAPRSNDRPVLTEPDLRALTFRTKREFHAKLVDRVVARGEARGYLFDRVRVTHVANQVMHVMDAHEPDDVPKMKDYEKLTLVLMMMHDDATQIVLSGPVIRNKLLPWSKRVDVVAKSYLTGLRRIYDMEVV